QPATKAPRRRTAAPAGGSVAAGARRAASEPRTASPLLRGMTASATDSRTTDSRDTAPTAAPTPPSAAPAAERRLRAVPDLSLGGPASAEASAAYPPARTAPRSSLLDLLGVAKADGIEGAVTVLAHALRVAAKTAGLDPSQAEEQVARTLAYLRRRASGDFTVDEFGFDADFADNVWLPVLRPIFEKWFRVEVRGIENIPATGGAL